MQLKINYENELLLNITVEDVLAYMQKQIGNNLAEITEASGNLLKYCEQQKIIKTRGMWFFTEEIKINNNCLCINDQKINCSSQVISRISGMIGAAVFVCTVGNNISDLSSTYFSDGKYFEGYITDIIGSLAAERYAQAIESKIKVFSHSKQYSTAARISPGYCGIDIIEQAKLLNLFADFDQPVTITETAMLRPIKSLCGIIPAGNIKINDYNCKNCLTKETCRYSMQDS